MAKMAANNFLIFPAHHSTVCMIQFSSHVLFFVSLGKTIQLKNYLNLGRILIMKSRKPNCMAVIRIICMSLFFKYVSFHFCTPFFHPDIPSILHENIRIDKLKSREEKKKNESSMIPLGNTPKYPRRTLRFSFLYFFVYC